MAVKTVKVQVKILKYLDGVFPEYQPEIGKVYDAVYSEETRRKAAICVIDVRDKKIALRKGEYEIVGG